MGADDEQLVQLVAQGTETFVWLVLALVCLSRARGAASLWAALASLGAVLLFIPAMTVTAARAQAMLFDNITIVAAYAESPLPTIYTVFRVVGAVLLLAALVGRRPAGAPSLAR